MDTTNSVFEELNLPVNDSNGVNTTICNISYPNLPDCTYFNSTNNVDRTETYLERSLGFLIIGIIGIVANLFVILVLGSSAKIRQKLVNTLIIHQSLVDFCHQLL